ncbi:MAG: hypothetical protein ACI9JN_001588 [Bacteroidia bacterium]|jgi:hypothetical protein
MVRFRLLSLALAISTVSFGQFTRGNSWSYTVYLGASNMLGDLGGSDQSASQHLKDVNFKAFRPAIGIGLQHHRNRINYTADVVLTRLIGNDAFSNASGRSIRNLSVRTDLVEVSLKAEILPFKNNNILKGLYINAGVGGIYFQPKAEFNGDWYKLRPLGTEGQNFLPNAKPYKTVSAIIPFGYGYKFNIGRWSTLKVDFSLRKTFTDYLDDVSTVYANTSAISEAGGSIAGLLSDRSTTGMTEGSQRGNNKHNDNYFLIGLKFEHILGSKKYNSCTNFEIPSRQKNH